VGIIPTTRAVSAISEGPSWNYTTVLNIVFLMVATVLVLRFLRMGGPAMLRMMNTPEEEMAQHDQGMAGMDRHAMGHGTGMEASATALLAGRRYRRRRRRPRGGLHRDGCGVTRRCTRRLFALA
jgi:hypothetical protein